MNSKLPGPGLQGEHPTQGAGHQVRGSYFSKFLTKFEFSVMRVYVFFFLQEFTGESFDIPPKALIITIVLVIRPQKYQNYPNYLWSLEREKSTEVMKFYRVKCNNTTYIKPPLIFMRPFSSLRRKELDNNY